jgi:hypothetical protein
MGIWLGPDGIQVAAIVFNDRPCLRVTKVSNGRRLLLAYCADVGQVAQHVDLSELVHA